MKTLVGVYETHDKALQAVNTLKSEGIDANNVSILGKADIIDNHVHIKNDLKAEKTEVSIGSLLEQL